MRSLWLALLCVLWAGHGAADSRDVARDDACLVRLPELSLTLTLPPLEGLAATGTNRWHGLLGASQVEIALRTLPSATYDFSEPEDVLEFGPSFWVSPEQARNEPGARHALGGPYGSARYAAWERSDLRSRDGKTALGVRFLFASLLPEAGYWITLEASPPPSAEGEARLFEFLEKGVLYDGALRDPSWTDAEARARWAKDAPSEVRSDVRVTRSAHYLVLSNSATGKSFAARMEECYAAVRGVYPFDEVAGRRLLPVLLFKTAEQYFDFYERSAGVPRDEAERSKGHAARDYYATWNDAPNDPVHLHEATRQLFANRLGLRHGGAWFQEGVAEYMATKPVERASAASEVRRGKHVPLARLVTLSSLRAPSGEGGSRRDEDCASRTEAALLIEFLRESPWAREAFPRFLARVGRLSSSDPATFEGVCRELYHVSLAELEQRWVEYCKAR